MVDYKKTEYNHQYYEEHKKEISAQKRQKYQQDKETTRMQQANYYQQHKEEVIERNRNNRVKNRAEINARRKDKHKKRMKGDINYRLRIVLRDRTRKALKKCCSAGVSIDMLGCSIEFLKSHLESMFYFNVETGEQMSWDNYGKYGWHIDHIIALVSFDLTDKEQVAKACHYTNLQPLWAKENISKGKKNMI